MLSYGYGQPYVGEPWALANDLTPDGSIASDAVSGATSNRRVPVRLSRAGADGAEAADVTPRFLLESLDRCVGCHTCEVACLQEHGEARVRLVTIGPTRDLEGEMRMEHVVRATDACDLCSERDAVGIGPACVRACPTRALAAVRAPVAARLLHGNRYQLCSFSVAPRQLDHQKRT